MKVLVKSSETSGTVADMATSQTAADAAAATSDGGWRQSDKFQISPIIMISLRAGFFGGQVSREVS